MTTRIRAVAAAVICTLGGAVALAAPANAAPLTVSATVGPVAIPHVPVSVCVNSTCVTTPAATTVSLTASVKVNLANLSLPTITPTLCSNGLGVAVVVHTGSLAGGVVTASVTLTVNGVPTTIPLGIPSGPNQTVTIGACASPGVPLPLV